MGGSTLLTALVLFADGSAQPVRHPEVPCWSGQRTWTAPGAPPSEMVTYDTEGEAAPFLITHNRDEIRQGAQLQQDYNFIDYWFGNPAFPVRARHYLRADGVSVSLPAGDGQQWTLEAARSALPPEILCYLQKRFDRIEILVEDGYAELWSRPR